MHVTPSGWECRRRHCRHRRGDALPGDAFERQVSVLTGRGDLHRRRRAVGSNRAGQVGDVVQSRRNGPGRDVARIHDQRIGARRRRCATCGADAAGERAGSGRGSFLRSHRHLTGPRRCRRWRHRWRHEQEPGKSLRLYNGRDTYNQWVFMPVAQSTRSGGGGRSADGRGGQGPAGGASGTEDRGAISGRGRGLPQEGGVRGGGVEIPRRGRF